MKVGSRVNDDGQTNRINFIEFVCLSSALSSYPCVVCEATDDGATLRYGTTVSVRHQHRYNNNNNNNNNNDNGVAAAVAVGTKVSCSRDTSK